MPQLVRDLRYCGHIEHGVEISESMSLLPVCKSNNSQSAPTMYIPMAAFDIMIVTAYGFNQKRSSLIPCETYRIRRRQ